LESSPRRGSNRERNGANFRTSLFHHSNPPAVAAPPNPEPTVDNDAVELHGIPCWTKQVDPEEITAELDYNLEEEDEQEYNDADAANRKILGSRLQEVQRDNQITSHMSKEVKKQPSTRFHIDASYKEAMSNKFVWQLLRKMSAGQYWQSGKLCPRDLLVIAFLLLMLNGIRKRIALDEWCSPSKLRLFNSAIITI
jgi:hypothetical protein